MKIDLTEKDIVYLARLLELNYADRQEDFEGITNIGSHNPNYDSLFSKLMYTTHGKFEDAWHEARKERFSLKEVSFDTGGEGRRLFLGAGYHTLFQLADLHRRLSFAAGELGGEQQNGGMGTEFDEQSSKEAKQNIKNVLRDIIHAFGYKPGDL